MKSKKLAYSLITSCIISTLAIPSYANTKNTFNYSVQIKKIHAVTTLDENRTERPLEIDYVVNPNNGPVLGILHNSQGKNGKNKYIIAVQDGKYRYAFKDMNKNGILDPFEDWRLPISERANNLANQLAATDEGIKKIAGLMLFSVHERDSKPGLTKNQIDYLDNNFVRNITDAANNDVANAVGWTNAMQAHVEQSRFNVPVNFSSDPRSTAGSGDLYSPAAEGSDISTWPSNIGLAATFNLEHVYNFAKASSAEYRAMGIATALGPQIDLATEPRWLRVGGTFGENVKLTTDIAQAYVDGSQSSYVKDGNDLGWGYDSINVMIKHYPGDGAAEGGREAHTDAGKYAVYPGNNHQEHIIPFAKGGMQLSGKTKCSASVMTSYSVAINADSEAYGGANNRKGSAYNAKKMQQLRDELNFNGVVCTDWGVTTEIKTFFMGWGAKNMSEAERHYQVLDLGSDMFGGNNNAQPIIDAFEIFKTNYGEEYARQRFALSAKRLLTLTMQVGLFENPYLDVAQSKTIVGSKDKREQGYQAQLDSIVMLKNRNNVISTQTKSKKSPSQMTVYIPMLYTEKNVASIGQGNGEWTSSLNLDIAKSLYKTVITDIKQPDGSYKMPDLNNVDKVIIGIRSPMNGGKFEYVGQIKNDDNSKTYYPLSLQYASYTADGIHVRKQSIAGDILADGTQENRSYFGQTSRILNSYDLDVILNTAQKIKQTAKPIPIVVALNASGPAIVSEFEDKVDAILVGFSVSDQALFDVINGQHEPNGLLPLQFPNDMDTVEANFEDVAHDMTPYTDSMGNRYDFAYGLNWLGVINDDRVKNYR